MQKLMGLVRRCVDDYNMIQAGDRIAVGVSGGKDSLVLLVLLAGLRKYFNKPLNWRPSPLIWASAWTTRPLRNFLQQLLGRNTLLTAVGTSQIISNVPAAVLLSGFTDQWREMLAGVNVGGLGTPIASLASLITLKLYMAWKDAKVLRFLGVFTVVNVIGLAVLLVFSTLLFL